MQGQTSEPEDSGAGTISAHFLTSRFLTQTWNPTDGYPSSHASDVRKMPRNENMSNTSSKWSISSVTPLRLLPLRQNGELGIHVLQEIAFSPVGEEMRGLFIHTELDPHPPQFFLAPVCYHVHTGSSIKHQARCEGMWQLWPRYSWGPHPRVTPTSVNWHESVYYHWYYYL